ncbi:MAG TPA: divalent-cation tolerance protein CutA [Acidimicrobiales bacterium]|nr:divalent-cation tolerance protein CutA [Acidimicrobiales bacterium]
MDAASGPAFYQVSVTAPSPEEAGSLGQMVVGRRLAACAQISGPISSTYWWDGEVRSAPEWQCTLKTTSSRLEELMAAVREAHSYEVPEIIATPIVTGEPAYLAWIAGETGD